MSELSFDVRNFEARQREKLAWRVRNSKDFKLPHLKYCNYSPCRKHRMGWEQEVEKDGKTNIETMHGPHPRCSKCGIELMQHQRVAIAWMYLKKKGLLADTPGLGKTFSAIGLLAMLYETGEIPDLGRAVFIPRSAALHQWRDQLVRAIPAVEDRILLLDSSHDVQKRKSLYLGDWDVLLIGPEMYRNDYEILEKLGKIELLVTDDIDQLRNPDTTTSYCIDRLGRAADRFFIMTGSPLQKRLPELHAVLDAVGGERLLGRRDAFIKRHVSWSTTTEEDQYGRSQSVTKIDGYRNLNSVKKRISPLVLRRTADDVKDSKMPDVLVSDVFLELYPPQRRKYEELQKSILHILKEDGTEQTKLVQAIAKLHYGSSICAGLATLGEADAPRTSIKFDWVMENIGEGGALSDEKVVIFANLRSSIEALQARMDNVGIKYVTIWGKEPNKRRQCCLSF